MLVLVSSISRQKWKEKEKLHFLSDEWDFRLCLLHEEKSLMLFNHFHSILDTKEQW
jgi:hypothetical protein